MTTERESEDDIAAGRGTRGRESRNGRGKRLAAGDVIGERELRTVTGEAVPVPEAGWLTHLQFRRFAGCPVCNLHLRTVAARHEEIAAAGVREVVMFHSPAEELLPHVDDLPFAVVADPGKKLYAEFGVESAPRALLDPRVYGTILRAVLRDLGPVLRGRRPLPSRRQPGGRLGLPADLLIAPDGRTLAAYYGTHAYDQWPVDHLLTLARTHRDALSS
ncbi:peroxiredoxin-like family protein [Sphaerisporangium sp. B11E5]|uniref:peroxiredoxin-like family protein n=1 Tax=Sphaerisporangium sp. B11E5 TaxID=3153563 RepID=UPI00325CC402